MKLTKDFSISEWKRLKSTIYEQTGCKFKNESLLKQAFIRSSYSSQYGGENNENLEFFGDSILSFYVKKAIAERYAFVKTSQYDSFDGDCEYSFRGSPEHFSRLCAGIVSNKNLASIIDDWDITQFLIVGKSDLDARIDEQEKPKADLFEAILGAIAVQYKWNSEILEKAVYKMLSLEEYFVNPMRFEYRPKEYNIDNAINTLKEIFEHGGCSMAKYEFSSPDEIGYDENGRPNWMCSCTVENWGISKLVRAHSKKDAKRFAAYLVLAQRYELENEYGITKNALPVWKFEDDKLILDIRNKEEK
ncbi:MAG: hypothetical protein MJ143_05750 [Clostridia bacterium]|nr:hypothetical protein [Clostridia bacterium]